MSFNKIARLAHLIEKELDIFMMIRLLAWKKDRKKMSHLSKVINCFVSFFFSTVKVVPTGVSKAMKKLMKTKLPDLGHHKDIADVFLDK